MNAIQTFLFCRGISSVTQREAFREHFSQLSELRAYTNCPVVAMTATADETIISSVVRSLSMKDVRFTEVEMNKRNIS